MTMMLPLDIPECMAVICSFKQALDALAGAANDRAEDIVQLLIKKSRHVSRQDFRTSLLGHLAGSFLFCFNFLCFTSYKPP
jgi:hypothetical protein